MQIRHFFTALFIISSLQGFAQDSIFRAIHAIYAQNPLGFENGIYENWEDFENKTPTKQGEELIFEPHEDGLSNGQFYYKATNRKVKNVLAIAYNDSLYINAQWMMRNFDVASRDGVSLKKYFLKAGKIGKYIAMVENFSFLTTLKQRYEPKYLLVLIYLPSQRQFKVLYQYKSFLKFIKLNHPDQLALAEQLENAEMTNVEKIVRVLSQTY